MPLGPDSLSPSPPPLAPRAGRSRPRGARESLKAAARGLALLLVSPVILWFRLKAAVIGRDLALEGSSEALSLLPGLPGRYLRRAFLAHALAGCHPTASVGFGSLFSKHGADIGAGLRLGRPELTIVGDPGLLFGSEARLLVPPEHGRSNGSSHDRIRRLDAVRVGVSDRVLGRLGRSRRRSGRLRVGPREQERNRGQGQEKASNQVN